MFWRPSRRRARPSEPCVAYIKRGVVGASGLGKKEVSLRHKRTKATQQDLDRHIYFCVKDEWYGVLFPTPRPLQRPNFEPCSPSHYFTQTPVK